MITAAVAFFLVIFLGGNYAIYFTVVHAFSITDSATLLWLKITFIILMISFPALQFLASQSFSLITKILYTASSVWLGVLFWLSLAVILYWITYGIISLVAPGTDISLVARIFIIGVLCINIYGVYHSFQIQVKNRTIVIEQLPSAWEGKRVILFSDSHFGDIRGARFSKKIVRAINEEKPDIVLIPGDFFDGPPLDVKSVTQPMSSISSTYGTYFAPGNHEEYGDEVGFLESLEDSGIHVLNNQKKTIEGLQIIGIHYSDTKTPQQQTKVLTGLSLDNNQPSILIKHEPANIEVAEAFGIDLQVSGHTHKGQMFPLSLFTKMIYGKFYYGLNNLGKTQVYTTSGVGTWGPPQRIGTDAEIVVIDLKSL